MKKLAIAALLAGSILAGSAQAATVAVGQGAFLPADIVVDFTAVPNEAFVGATYAGSGVTFSGALIGMTNGGDTNLFPSNGDGVIASNWNYSQGSNLGLSFEAAFSSLQSRVGFFLENWSEQTATVELFDGAASVGFLALDNTAGLDAEFRGVSSTAKFNRLVFTNSAETNGFFAIDNFVFGDGAGAVPEASTWAMMLIGFGVVGAAMRRRQNVKVSFA